MEHQYDLNGISVSNKSSADVDRGSCMLRITLKHVFISCTVQLWDSFFVLDTEKQVRPGLQSYELRRTHLP